ncbi:hypothetical protein [uncultured Methanobrevibacter sp.]|uniref:hypothetical protein n=1 Tax=uncultured Methanobrevibacter sp. TaxID=253161 RepID=UPI00261403BC
MITITKKEEDVLNHIKAHGNAYDEFIPMSLIKDEMNIYEHDLNDLLNSLKALGLVIYENSNVKLERVEEEINTVDSKQDVLLAELNQKEKASFELIKRLVDDENMVSRYKIEGSLLYGDLHLTDFRMYHIILSLENKGLIEPIYKENGDYYKLL